MSEGMDVQVFRRDGVWTKPAGAVTVDVILIGGGGGGASPGADGGDGDIVVRSFPADDLSASLSVTVGRGGSAGRGQCGVTGSPGYALAAGGAGADGVAVVITRLAPS